MKPVRIPGAPRGVAITRHPVPRMRRARRFLRDLVAFLKSPRCRL